MGHPRKKNIWSLKATNQAGHEIANTRMRAEKSQNYSKVLNLRILIMLPMGTIVRMEAIILLREANANSAGGYVPDFFQNTQCDDTAKP
jgi:hypothetical protein